MIQSFWQLLAKPIRANILAYWRLVSHADMPFACVNYLPNQSHSREDRELTTGQHRMLEEA